MRGSEKKERRFAHLYDSSVFPSGRKEGSMQSKKSRRTRRDAGAVLLTERDLFALLWIGQQYGIRLDQLQRLLGQRPGRGAAHRDWISEGAARDVVTRWKRAGWARSAHIRAKEPFWIFLSRAGLRTFGLTYAYRDLVAANVHDLNHLYGINEVRLDLDDLLDDPDADTTWVSERDLLQGVMRQRGKDLPHRPDAIFSENDDVSAIEVELSAKSSPALAETLIELVRGDEYLRLKGEFGTTQARTMSQGLSSPYTRICYYAPPTIRKLVRRTRARLVHDDVLSEQEAERIEVYWYPLAHSDQELAQEEQEGDR